MPLPSPIQAEAAAGNPVVLPAVPTKFEALKFHGWILPYDYAIITILVLSMVTLFFWRVFGSPTALNLVAAMLVNIFVAQLWIVSLVFRCSCFVLETQADINLMPEAAARIVTGYYNSGQASLKPK